MGILFIGRAMAFARTFAVPLVLVRIFTPELFGLYKQLFLIYMFTATLTFGFSGKTLSISCRSILRNGMPMYSRPCS